MQKEYTPIRQFYAWVGFITLVCLAIAFVAWIVEGNRVLAVLAHGL
jgi:hypothetical protein